MPIEIPKTPNSVYNKDGWAGMGDWLGTFKVSKKNMIFEEFHLAREFVRKLNIKNAKEWLSYCQSGKKPDYIPASPNIAYKNSGWINLQDWLDSNNIQNQKRQFLEFDEAKELVKKFNLKNGPDWYNFCKLGKKPEEVPLNPDHYYIGKWKGWNDFLDSI